MRTGTPEFAPIKRIRCTTPRQRMMTRTLRQPCAIYAYHTQSNGWNDIGYNFVMDAQGRIYEGRYARCTYKSGEVPTGEDVDGNGSPCAH